MAKELSELSVYHFLKSPGDVSLLVLPRRKKTNDGIPERITPHPASRAHAPRGNAGLRRSASGLVLRERGTFFPRRRAARPPVPTRSVGTSSKLPVYHAFAVVFQPRN